MWLITGPNPTWTLVYYKGYNRPKAYMDTNLYKGYNRLKAYMNTGLYKGYNRLKAYMDTGLYKGYKRPRVEVDNYPLLCLLLQPKLVLLCM